MRALEVAKQARKVAEEQANRSRWAVADVKAALNFPIDNVSCSLLFSTRLEKEGKLNQGQIIRFLPDHSRKIERTGEQM